MCYLSAPFQNALLIFVQIFFFNSQKNYHYRFFPVNPFYRFLMIFFSVKISYINLFRDSQFLVTEIGKR